MRTEKFACQSVFWQDFTWLLACSTKKQVVWAITSLIIFEVVKCHRPDQVMRLFEMQQSLPPLYDTSLTVHVFDRRGPAATTDWSIWHASFIAMWEQRNRYVVEGLTTCLMPKDNLYMIWYRLITRRFITRPQYSDPGRFNPSTSLMHEKNVVPMWLVLRLLFIWSNTY